MNTASEIKADLIAAIEARDAAAFEEALNHAFRDDSHAGLSSVLTKALLLPWHTRHEDLAHALQELKDPASVNALANAAMTKHPYLEYDNSHALARKCTWALADIGTHEARARLEELARSADDVVASYAQRRLERWEDELPRKGA